MKVLALVIGLVVFTASSEAKDHAKEYVVGRFQSTGQVGDGTYASCQGGNCASFNVQHNIHFVSTREGIYVIQPPINETQSIALALGSHGLSPMAYKDWFMDQLHDGDKVLFAAHCKKHNYCHFWLPDPDKPGKEFSTEGNFSPYNAKTNTKTLCGKGKLSPAVEAEVCTP